jgi:hypothetical protein
MAHADEHIQALLKLPTEERARVAKLLLDSLDQAPSVVAQGTAGYPMSTGSLVAAMAAHFGDGQETADYPGNTGPDADHGGLESDDELADLDDLAADKEGLRAAVRAAVEAELQPLNELTRLLSRFAELARTTGHVLRARTA